MYADPRHIRNCRINLSVTETELRAIEALAELNGTQPSVFARELITEFMLSRQANFDCADAKKRRANGAQIG